MYRSSNLEENRVGINFPTFVPPRPLAKLSLLDQLVTPRPPSLRYLLAQVTGLTDAPIVPRNPGSPPHRGAGGRKKDGGGGVGG